MEITKAKERDLIEILYLLKACISDMQGRGITHWNSAYPDAETIQQDLKEGRIFLLKERQVCKGMMTLSTSEPEAYKDLRWQEGAVKAMYLQRMAVHPKWQGQGLGSQLIRFAGDFAQRNGFSCIRLDVFNHSEHAKRLYENHDFYEVGTFLTEAQKVPYICYEKQL
jgi:ribosomal protein S18 acetylase RimI-like enzyme